MICKDDGSMFVGHNASRRFGGPDMYRVASSELMPGCDEGKRRSKAELRRDGGGAVETRCALRVDTTGHVCFNRHKQVNQKASKTHTSS